MMLVLALLLFTIGVADALRPLRVQSVPPLVPALVCGLVAAILGAWAIALPLHDWWIVVALMLVLTAWLIVSSLPHPRARVASLAVLAGAVLVVLAFGQHVDPGDGPVLRWYRTLDIAALDGVDAERFVLAACCLVFLHSSANVVVRLVLAGSGPHVLESENTLKGGRILGPLERWFIFSMALAGQLGAIAAVVAAKGIVRFPEISRSDTSGNKAEYVLVGSFVSWLLALVFVPLIK